MEEPKEEKILYIPSEPEKEELNLRTLAVIKFIEVLKKEEQYAIIINLMLYMREKYGLDWNRSIAIWKV